MSGQEKYNLPNKSVWERRNHLLAVSKENSANCNTAKINWMQLAKFSGVWEKKYVQITEDYTLVQVLLGIRGKSRKLILNLKKKILWENKCWKI